MVWATVHNPRSRRESRWSLIEDAMGQLISAVIPTRNRPELVCRAVRSALSQTYLDLEVVVVVDGPDPATVAILEALHEPRLQIVALPENVGGCEARNIGVRKARGCWIAFLDDDDEWEPTKTEKQIALTKGERDNRLVVTCRVKVRFDDLDYVIPAPLPQENEPISEYLFGRPTNVLLTSSYLCLKQVLLDVPWGKGLSGIQDMDWILRVLTGKGVRLKVVNEPLTIYWKHANSSVSKALDWRAMFQWGQANRALLSPRAYSYFLARICVNLAVQQRAGLSDLLKLFREFFIAGRPTGRSILLLVGYTVVPSRYRRFIYYSVSKALRFFKIS
jgi:glycosyltransferase involved in cell wall biosynthesis